MGHRQWQGDGRDRGEERGRGRGRRRHSRWQDGDGQVHTGPLPVTLCTRGFLHTQPDTHLCRYMEATTHTCTHTHAYTQSEGSHSSAFPTVDIHILSSTGSPCPPARPCPAPALPLHNLSGCGKWTYTASGEENPSMSNVWDPCPGGSTGPRPLEGRCQIAHRCHVPTQVPCAEEGVAKYMLVYAQACLHMCSEGRSTAPRLLSSPPGGFITLACRGHTRADMNPVGDASRA